MMLARPLALAAIALALLTGATPAPARPAGPACDPATFHVVLDVGHSAEVPGATSARGVPEFTYNLALSNALHRRLREAGYAQAELLITPGASLRGLIERTAHANDREADLFISVHHDSVPEQFLEYWEYGGKRQHFSDRFRGHSLFVSRENAAYEASLRFARLLGRELKSAGMTYTPHYAEAFMGRRRRDLLDAATGVYRFDELHVLRRTDMPAVLFEAGSIVNRDEELLLGQPAYHDRIAAALVRAVDAYCLGGARPPATAAAEPPAPRAPRR